MAAENEITVNDGVFPLTNTQDNPLIWDGVFVTLFHNVPNPEEEEEVTYNAVFFGMNF